MSGRCPVGSMRMQTDNEAAYFYFCIVWTSRISLPGVIVIIFLALRYTDTDKVESQNPRTKGYHIHRHHENHLRAIGEVTQEGILQKEKHRVIVKRSSPAKCLAISDMLLILFQKPCHHVLKHGPGVGLNNIPMARNHPVKVPSHNLANGRGESGAVIGG